MSEIGLNLMLSADRGCLVLVRVEDQRMTNDTKEHNASSN